MSNERAAVKNKVQEEETQSGAAHGRRDRSFLSQYKAVGENYGSIEQTSYPGATDELYRHRRDQVVALSMESWPELPQYHYLPEEHATWSYLAASLKPLQDRYACSAFLRGREALSLPMGEVPQLDAISAQLEGETGFLLAPVGGLLEAVDFLSALGDRVMRCTAYMRHHEHPDFTPEPDIIHELWGHAPMFMDAEFASFSEKIGETAKLARTFGYQDIIDRLQRLYWYTIEYGLIEESGQLKVFGAGNNAGLQDLQRSVSDTVEKRPLSDEIYTLAIDYDRPQDLFYVAESFAQVEEMVSEIKRTLLSREPDRSAR
ncbi:MAG: hypothetical protein VYD19_01120 [Myxococcota bacterium]|nr:hypothetical protein [Myxococcota bacterium]